MLVVVSGWGSQRLEIASARLPGWAIAPYNPLKRPFIGFIVGDFKA